MKAELELVDRYSPRITGVVRTVTGLLFLEHGSAKLSGVPHIGMFDGLHLFSLMGGSRSSRIGSLLALGLLTRPVAFILSGEMATAYFMAHPPQAFLPPVNRGEAAVLYCFFFLYLFFAGAGAFGIDAIRNEAR